MMLKLILVGLLVFALLWFYGIWRLNQAKKRLAELEQETEQLRQQKAVAESQVKHFEVRKNNEKTHRTSARDELIERLHQSDDLRD